ncbi:hypothetical protein P3R38_09085 [Pseudomonas sp. NyZ480]|uniref:hypothetical protein n=1 Tax=Pseudomonas sp. NyZ480 TaxID=3035289 RepID=UPI002409F010|nr:hypothetical protein [Pseudomonas sp. NyZ480]WEZ90396.1 hypothetical protein P3R38_09085 [Pseudomonas sp. NyZ480]
MAMFELEDSDRINIEGCKSDSETLLKGARLKDVTAVDCEVQQKPVQETPNLKTGKLLGLSIGWAMTIVAGVIVAAISTWLGLS